MVDVISNIQGLSTRELTESDWSDFTPGPHSVGGGVGFDRFLLEIFNDISVSLK